MKGRRTAAGSVEGAGLDRQLKENLERNEACCREGTCAVVCKLADAVQAEVHNLLADGVVTAGKVVCGILLAADELLGVEQLAVCARPDLVNHSGLQGRQELAHRALSLSLKAYQDREYARACDMHVAHICLWLTLPA